MMTNRLLLFCGILSSAWYVVINVVVPLQFPGYDQMTYTVSELSAIGAPTRSIWVPLAMLYILFFAAFGWGVLSSSGDNRRLQLMGMLILVYSLLNVYWPPMHPRGTEPTLTDTLHIVWSFVTVLLMMTIMVLGAAALGNGFRVYTVATLVLHIIFGFLTSLEAPNIPKDLPTPWIGLWERILIGLFLVWVIVLAILLLKRNALVVPVRLKQKAGVS
jgi:hypothetical protein